MYAQYMLGNSLAVRIPKELSFYSATGGGLSARLSLY
jgi:hypothetical protein